MYILAASVVVYAATLFSVFADRDEAAEKENKKIDGERKREIVVKVLCSLTPCFLFLQNGGAVHTCTPFWN